MCFRDILHVDTTLRNQRPPHQPPELPHCYARYLKVPRSFKEVMRSEHAENYRYSEERELYGLLGAGTFAPVY